jgi:hypothetical protein
MSKQALDEAVAERLELLPSNGASGYRGVYPATPSATSFKAVVTEDGKQKLLGCFHTAEEAALCYARHTQSQYSYEITLTDKQSPTARQLGSFSSASAAAEFLQSFDPNKAIMPKPATKPAAKTAKPAAKTAKPAAMIATTPKPAAKPAAKPATTPPRAPTKRHRASTDTYEAVAAPPPAALAKKARADAEEKKVAERRDRGSDDDVFSPSACANVVVHQFRAASARRRLDDTFGETRSRMSTAIVSE